ncbi:hypothetical protein [uncultured Ramlibacter sp.]|uniref:hypothetical protein n=1 Tax=uncultured Ramlibacter sp. TaxID=260755 RepID=UPI002634757A|nr:hypothetical protein [uncultured Ramlibacter sp.]
MSLPRGIAANLASGVSPLLAAGELSALSRSGLVPGFAMSMLHRAAPPEETQERQDIPLEELRFIHLKTHQDIERVRALRGAIQLPAAALSDPYFHAREKKETSTV